MTPAQGNHDPAELAKFNALAHRWWDSEGEFAPLHAINPLRLDFIEADGPVSGLAVCDVGCGGGILSEGLAERGARVTGIDLAGDALTVAREHAQSTGLSVAYLQVAVEEHAQEYAGHYDAVTCMEMLEHVPDPASVVAACARLVRPGGRVYLSTLSKTPRAWLFAIAGAEYLLRLMPRGTHDYRKFIRPSRLLTHCRAAGLHAHRASGLGYNPLTRHYFLTADTGVNYMLACRRESDA